MNKLMRRINDLNHEKGREKLRNPQWTNELEQRMLQFQKMLKTLKVNTEGKKVVGRLLLDDDSPPPPRIPKVMTVILPPKYMVPALVYERKTHPNHHVGGLMR